ncbi:PAS domain-containing protein [Azospirillum humicireducens]|uniref:PAS domain-containing protein n=1 Tax=Azospirillum humicireducens TaxID=1226968 RepID=UPI001F24A9D8|nr:PAS domain-containing protein [Azospirillum humicireducens]
MTDAPLLVLCGPNGGYLALSDSTRRYFGPVANQMLGNGWISAIHPDDQLLAADSWLRAVFHDAAYDLQLRYRRYDGCYRAFAVRAVRFFDQLAHETRWLVGSEPLDE